MKTYKDLPGDGGSQVVEQVTELADRLKARLASVRYVLAVMSGKGGVGKSAVTVNLAAALAQEGAAVGLLDADVNGPSLARMTGVQGQRLQLGEAGVGPAVGALGLKVMSMDLFLADARTPVLWDAATQKDAYAWRGMMEAAAVREFLADTAWGTLDFLFVDLPPGADKLPNLTDLFPQLSGTVVVTLPSGISRFVVSKSIQMAREVLLTPVIGLVENMASYVCPACGKEAALFPTGQAARLAAEHGLPLLSRVPFDPRIAACADEGRLFMDLFGDTPAGTAFRHAARGVRQFLDADDRQPSDRRGKS